MEKKTNWPIFLSRIKVFLNKNMKHETGRKLF